MSIIEPKENPIQSPCIAMCELNRSDVCKGCFRSRQEIADWSQSNNDEKMQVLENAYQRALRQNPRDF